MRGKELKNRNRELHYEWIRSKNNTILDIAAVVLEQNLKKSYTIGFENIKMMMRLLLHKYSTCFYLSVLGILKVLNF